jgi:hypothetical protein
MEAPKLMWKTLPSRTRAGTDLTPNFSASAHVGHGGAEVDVEDIAVQDQGGHRFDAEFLGFVDTVALVAEMHHFHIKLLGVERGGDLLFCLHANGAAGMVKDCFASHDDFPFLGRVEQTAKLQLSALLLHCYAGRFQAGVVLLLG